jgi:Carbohydrate binding module (family 6)
MTTPASAPPGVYHSRSRVTRIRVASAAAGLALVLLGYLIGRLQGGSQTPAAAARPSVTSSPAVAATASAEPSSPPTTPAPGGTDAYSIIQVEAASGQQGTQVQDTEDAGGGQNVGWIGNGDWLRFDDVDFGDQPARTFAARVAADTDDDGGRIEVRIDSPGNEPAGTLTIEDTGGWQDWESDKTEITPTTGRHTVFLTFGRDGDGEFVNLNYFAFTH